MKERARGNRGLISLPGWIGIRRTREETLRVRMVVWSSSVISSSRGLWIGRNAKEQIRR